VTVGEIENHTCVLMTPEILTRWLDSMASNPREPKEDVYYSKSQEMYIYIYIYIRRRRRRNP